MQHGIDKRVASALRFCGLAALRLWPFQTDVRKNFSHQMSNVGLRKRKEKRRKARPNKRPAFLRFTSRFTGHPTHQ